MCALDTRHQAFQPSQKRPSNPTIQNRTIWCTPPQCTSQGIWHTGVVVEWPDKSSFPSTVSGMSLRLLGLEIED